METKMGLAQHPHQNTTGRPAILSPLVAWHRVVHRKEVQIVLDRPVLLKPKAALPRAVSPSCKVAPLKAVLARQRAVLPRVALPRCKVVQGRVV